MRLHVEESMEYTDVDITIRCPMVDDELTHMIEQIRMYGFAVKGQQEEKTFLIKPSSIYYIESVDDRTFLYTKADVYGSDQRLYSLEEKLRSGSFIRVSKSCIVNLKKINGFKSQINGRLEAVLLNGEKIQVSRHYVAPLKERINQMGV